MRQLRVHALIRGQVQGVGFRAWTKKHADELGLCGWVRNLENGTVEASFEGEESVIRQMIELLKRGPKNAQVLGIESFFSEVLDEYKNFSIK